MSFFKITLYCSKRGCFEARPIRASCIALKMSGIKIAFAMHLVNIACVDLQRHHRLEIKMTKQKKGRSHYATGSGKFKMATHLYRQSCIVKVDNHRKAPNMLYVNSVFTDSYNKRIQLEAVFIIYHNFLYGL